MPDFAAVADTFVATYNKQDFDALEAMIAPDIDFAHFNRNFVLNNRDELVGILRQFASDFLVTRHFEEPVRKFVAGNTVIREAWYVGTCAVDLEGFGKAGEAFRLRFCSVMRFDDAGILVEWKDYG